MTNFAIELCFDKELEARVRRARRALLEVPINVRVDYPRPHISLAVVGPGAGVPDLESVVAEFSREQCRFAVTLSSVGTFTADSGVVFLAPVPCRQLMDAHAALQSGLAARGIATWDYYTLGRWVPHCTLAEDVGPQEMGCAMAIVAAAGLPMHGWCERVSLVEVPSGNVVLSEGLGAA